MFYPLIVVGGVIQGFGLAYSGMARPEVVLEFLQFEDFGLLLVMGGAAAVSGVTFVVVPRVLDGAPLTGDPHGRRIRSMDRDVVVGGVVFGVGWGISGICPGAAYASLGVGNVEILWAVAGMFLGAYVQAYWRAHRSAPRTATPTTSD
nr:DUF6691 family protein [Halomarina oriensis]